MKNNKSEKCGLFKIVVLIGVKHNLLPV